MWIADDQAELSWLFLVSAVETAATFWRTQKDPPVERFSLAHPEVVALLLKSGGDDLLNKVATELEKYLGATMKFIDFLVAFLPDPPDTRPENYKINWEEPAMRQSFRVIYGWRSRALHGGTPFPEPMCEAPQNYFGYPERPMGLAAMRYGGLWTKDDMPMLLHTFEYIVRGALLKWWQSMAGGSE